MAEPTWDRRERPMLDLIVALDGAELELHRAVRIPNIPASHLSERDKYLAVRALAQAGYITATEQPPYGDDPFPDFVIHGPTERGRRATGQWPAADAYTDLVRTLEHRAELATDADEKSRLRKALDAITSLGRDVATEVLAKVIEHSAGM